jgi:hypothetical protein
MTVLGIRCWPEKLSYVAAGGNLVEPILVGADTHRSPQGISRASFLYWVFRETEALVGKYNPCACRIKVVEPTAQKNARLLERCEVEGVVRAALYHSGCRDIETVYKQQIKASVGFGQRAKYVSRALEGTVFADLVARDEEDAALAAWSALGSAR